MTQNYREDRVIGLRSQENLSKYKTSLCHFNYPEWAVERSGMMGRAKVRKAAHDFS